MSGPAGPRPGEDPSRAMPTAPAPTLTTTPAEGPRRWWSLVPHHLGRARTSTVVLAVLFVAIGVLYLYVRPESTGTAPAGDTGDVPVVPAPVTTPAGPTPTPTPTPTARPTTPAPSTTAGTDDGEGTTDPTGPTGGEEPTSEPSESSPTPTAARTPSGSPGGGSPSPAT